MMWCILLISQILQKPLFPNLEESVSIFKLTNLKIKDLDDFKLEENEYQKIKSFIYNYYLDKLDLKINALK